LAVLLLYAIFKLVLICIFDYYLSVIWFIKIIEIALIREVALI